MMLCLIVQCILHTITYSYIDYIDIVSDRLILADDIIRPIHESGPSLNWSCAVVIVWRCFVEHQVMLSPLGRNPVKLSSSLSLTFVTTELLQ